MLTPAPLYPGARVALVAPASPVPPERLSPAVEAVRALGLEPVVYPSCRPEHRRGYLAAPDPVRAGDIQAAFCDNSIAGVLCIRGGYGANRILPLLDWAAIARHPKVFAGYSDITALHIVLNQRCGLVTYHTIMPSTEYWEPVDPFSMGGLRRALFGGLTGVLPLPEGAVPVPLAPGRAEGVLCGGNLTLVCTSLGTPWEIDTRGKLLFLEDIGEKPRRIDAMLTQLRNAGKFADCAGVILGAWTDCPEEEGDLPLEESFRELILPAGKPVLAGVPCGHVLPTWSLPLGARAVLDAGAGRLEVLS